MSETKRTPTAITNALRSAEFAKLTELLAGAGYEVLLTKGAQCACPVVDEEGGERYIRVTLEVPKGDRAGNPYDGHAEAEAFALDQAEKEAKALARKAEAERKRKAKEAKSA